MSERSVTHHDLGDGAPESDFNRANALLGELQERLNHDALLQPDDYMRITRDVETINHLLASADHIGAPAEIIAHADYVFLPRLAVDDQFWPPDSALPLLPHSSVQNDTFARVNGEFRGIDFISHNDSPTLFYRLKTGDGHDLTGHSSYQSIADISHSSLMFAHDIDMIKRMDLDDTLAPYLHAITQLGHAFQQNDPPDFEAAASAIDFLLNTKSPYHGDVEFERVITDLVNNQLPQDNHNWCIEADYAVEIHNGHGTHITRVPLPPVSFTQSDLELQCLPRMRVATQSHSKQPHTTQVRVNQDRRELYIITPSLSGECVTFIPFSAIESISQADENEDGYEE